METSLKGLLMSDKESHLVFHPCEKCNSEDYKDFELPRHMMAMFDRLKEITPTACDQCTYLKEADEENTTLQ